MNGDITQDPLARAVLQHLAGTRQKDDPLGSLARTVLDGEAKLREAANDPWHSQGLAAAAKAAVEEQSGMSPEQRNEIEQSGRRLQQRTAAGNPAPGEES